MYTVKFNDTIIQDLRFDNLILQNPTITTSQNEIGIFEFTMLKDNQHYDLVDYGKNEVTVLKNDKPIFIGRITDIATGFYEDKQVTCECIISYLIDSQVRPYDFSGRPIDMWNNMINQHNAQVDEYKQFKIGTIITDDPNDYIARSSINTENTYKVITEKLVSSGIWFVNYEDRSINYYAEFTEIVEQEIVLRENLIDFSRSVSDETFCTRLIPYGKDKLDITSVNNGLDYIQNDAMVEKYGIITKTIEYDDVTVASNLKTKAEDYLIENVYFSETLNITAVDLSNIDASIESFKLNYRVRVIIENHGIDKIIQITQKTINLNSPESDTFTLGNIEATSSGSTVDTTIKFNNAFNDDNTLNASIIKGVMDLQQVNLQAQLTSASETDVRAILFEDIDPLSSTYGALSIGTQGIQIAREKNVDNLWEWGTAIDFQSIYADYIITGMLSDKLGRNTWNLDTGDFVTSKGTIGGWDISSNGLSSSGGLTINKNGVTNIYTWADLYIIRLIIEEVISADEDMVFHYDFSGDGEITSLDYVVLKNMLKAL